MLHSRQVIADRASALGSLEAYHTAMVAADTEALERLLAPHFELVHITGYIQPKNEWLQLVRTGRFNYHQVDIDQDSVSVIVRRDTSRVNGRGVFNATINGTHAPWRLEFVLEMRRHGMNWLIAHASYATY